MTAKIESVEVQVKTFPHETVLQAGLFHFDKVLPRRSARIYYEKRKRAETAQFNVDKNQTSPAFATCFEDLQRIISFQTSPARYKSQRELSPFNLSFNIYTEKNLYNICSHLFLWQI